jgi:hypothetical protein
VHAAHKNLQRESKRLQQEHADKRAALAKQQARCKELLQLKFGQGVDVDVKALLNSAALGGDASAGGGKASSQEAAASIKELTNALKAQVRFCCWMLVFCCCCVWLFDVPDQQRQWQFSELFTPQPTQELEHAKQIAAINVAMAAARRELLAALQANTAACVQVNDLVREEHEEQKAVLAKSSGIIAKASNPEEGVATRRAHIAEQQELVQLVQQQAAALSDLRGKIDKLM